MKICSKYFILSIVLSLFFNCQANIWDYRISNEEAAQMTTEADDYIDSIEDGLQDREADAILHALKFHPSELKQFRELSSKAYFPVSDKVNEQELSIILPNEEAKGYLYSSKIKNNKRKRLLIFFHSGGLTMGGYQLTQGFCSNLASTGDIDVVSFDYPLLPEHSLSQIIDYIDNIISYFISNSKKFGVEKKNISIGGSGAGANLVLSSLLSIHETGKELSSIIKSVVLFYPVCNFNLDRTESVRKYGRGYGFDYRLAEAFKAALTEEVATDNGAIYESLSKIKMPPTLIITAERDILFDQQTELIKNLKENGFSVRDIIFEGSVHGFIEDGAQKKAFNKAIELTESFLTE